MLKKFLPKETSFFDFFEAHSALIVEACENLIKLPGSTADVAGICSKVKEIESKADRITHECMTALHHTFITPFDRNDIRRLISRLDDMLDLIEEFRQPVVDRTVIGLINKGVKLEQDERGRFTKETARMLATRVLDRLEGNEPYEQKKYPLRAIIQQQARHLATFLRNERLEYEPFVATW